MACAAFSAGGAIEIVFIHYIINSVLHQGTDGQYTYKKVYYLRYTDTHRFLLKIYNIHVLREFWKIYNILLSQKVYSIYFQNVL